MGHKKKQPGEKAVLKQELAAEFELRIAAEDVRSQVEDELLEARAETRRLEACLRTVARVVARPAASSVAYERAYLRCVEIARNGLNE